MAVEIYHNPDCATSRNTLALIRAADIEPTVIEYLKTPPDRERLRDLAGRAGLSIRDILRERGTPFRELGLDDPELSDDALLDAVEQHPILMNRPLVATPDGVRLCRPAEIVLDLLPPFEAPLTREDGSPFLVDQVAEPGPQLDGELRAAALPTEDVGEAGRTFFRYRTLAGAPAGIGGFELYGPDALLRSIAVPPASRATGVGRNLLLLLMGRAYQAGARRAFVLTEAATPFFERNGFKVVDRESAPPAIQGTRQFSGICPSSAKLAVRSIAI